MRTSSAGQDVSLGDQNCPEVVDVSQSRPSDETVAERLEKPVSVIVGEAAGGVNAARKSALQRVRRDIRAGDLFQTVDAVRITGKRVNAGPTLERQREGKQELDIAAAAAGATHGYGG